MLADSQAAERFSQVYQNWTVVDFYRAANAEYDRAKQIQYFGRSLYLAKFRCHQPATESRSPPGAAINESTSQSSSGSDSFALLCRAFSNTRIQLGTIRLFHKTPPFTG